MKGRVRSFVGGYWRAAVRVILIMGIAGGLLFFRLGSLPGGSALVEKTSLAQAHSLHIIASNPLNAPYKLVTHALVKLHHTSTFTTRSVSALFGLAALMLFYYLIKRLATPRVALLSTLLFATSSWFLHTARLATPEILNLFWLALAASIIWLTRSKFLKISLLVTVLLCAVGLYIPGLIWFYIIIGIWQHKLVWRLCLKLSPLGRALFSLVFIVAISPLVWSFIQRPTLIKLWLGLPEAGLSWHAAASNLWHVPLYLTLRGPRLPVFWLGQLPLLDLFSVAMVLLGGYAYFYKRRLFRARVLIIGISISWFLIGLRGPQNLTILLPFIYILAAAGITLMLQQWATVFPRNPLARIVAGTLMGCAVAVTCFYHLNHYFVAWPNAPETEAVFRSSATIDPK